MAKPKNNIKRDFIVPLLGIIGCLYQIFFSWLIVYAIVVIFATCFNMAHSKLIATIRAMRDYLTILEARAAIEGVELDG